jgi:hypothetical protein
MKMSHAPSKFVVVIVFLAMVGVVGYMAYDINLRSNSPIIYTSTVLQYYQMNTVFGYQTHVTFLSGKLDTENLHFQGKFDFEIGKTYTITYYKNFWTDFRTIVDIKIL